jgi:hypothetical protein
VGLAVVHLARMPISTSASSCRHGPPRRGCRLRGSAPS